MFFSFTNAQYDTGTHRRTPGLGHAHTHTLTLAFSLNAHLSTTQTIHVAIFFNPPPNTKLKQTVCSKVSPAREQGRQTNIAIFHFIHLNKLVSSSYMCTTTA